MLIPINDLKRSYHLYQNEIETKVMDVIRSGYFILGPEVDQFEQEFADAVGTKYCVSVGNGLDAIMLGVRALNIGPGDEVIVQANTYIATVLGFTHSGAVPVFTEPGPYYNIDAKEIENSITKKTKAVLVTHLYGQATDMDRIIDICKSRNIVLLEDCAQSHFSEYMGKTTGQFGLMGFFSFYPTKNLGAFGDGGAVVTNDPNLAEFIKKLRNYGSIKRYQNDVEGFNSRLDELQAGILRVKLKYRQQVIDERRKIASSYLKRTKNQLITLPLVSEGSTHVWHLFVIEVEERERFRKHMYEVGVSTDIHYPIPPHLSKAYKRLGYKEGDFPITETMSQRIVTLPLFNGMTDEEVKRVIEGVNNYEKKC